MRDAVDQQPAHADVLDDLLDQVALAAKALQDSRRRRPDDSELSGALERLQIDAAAQRFRIDLPRELLEGDEQPRLILMDGPPVENPEAQRGFSRSPGGPR
jgi:hypothetical protein